MNYPTFFVLRRISLENNYDTNPTHLKLPVCEAKPEKSRKLVHWFSRVEGRWIVIHFLVTFKTNIFLDYEKVAYSTIKVVYFSILFFGDEQSSMYKGCTVDAIIPF